MRLYSVQPKEIYDKIMTEGIYICNPEKSSLLVDDCNNMFNNAYKWLINEMNIKIGNVDKIKYPVWAWYKYDGTNEFPDLNLIADNTIDNVIIEIEVPDNEVLLSDFDLWHCVINNSYLNMGEGEEFDKLEDIYDRLPKNEQQVVKLNSWQNIFNIEESSNYIQATFWSIKKDMIVSVTELYPVIYLDDIIYYLENDPEYNILNDIPYENIEDFIESYIKNYINTIQNRMKYKVELSLDELVKINDIKIDEQTMNKLRIIGNHFGIDIEKQNKKILNSIEHTLI